MKRPAIDPVSLPLLEHTEPNLQLEVAMQDDVWISESLVMGLHLLLSCVGYDTSCSSPSKTSLIFVLVVIL